MKLDQRASFLNVAGLVQGGLLLGALFVAALADIPLLEQVRWVWHDVGWGLLATLPMLLVLVSARRLRRLVTELIGPSLNACRWYDLLLLALLAGAGEELLFRGLLQAWIGRLHPWAGIIGANLLFGIAHALSPGYALLAASFGFYLSWLAVYPDSPNLLRPIVTHAAYDYLAFLWIVREFRQQGHTDGPR